MVTDRREFYEQTKERRLRGGQRYYQKLLRNFFAFLVPPGLRVLELGCGTGELLAAVKPLRGVGVDFSAAVIEEAKNRHPQLQFQLAEATEYRSDEKFDYIVLSDLINDLPDVQRLFEQVQRNSFQHTRLVLNFYNTLWRPVLTLAEKMGWKSPTLPQNWLSLHDVTNLLNLAGWEVIKRDTCILWPVPTPFLEVLLNRWVAPLLKHFCLSVFVVARPRPLSSQYRNYSCSVVIPARNEAGNIEAAVLRTPEMGMGTEMIFIEGHSTDDTWEQIERVAKSHPERNIKMLKQQSKGKGGAVREAFAMASGDLLFILDADLTVPPEDLPKFYSVACAGTADFINGVRLIYPMENEAMRFLNMIGNRFFSMAFTWLLGQPIKDTLCGTKVIFRSDRKKSGVFRRF